MLALQIPHATLRTLSLAGLLVSLACANGEAATAQQPQTLEERASYVIGYNLGKNLRSDQIEASLELIRQGLEHGFEGKEPLLDDAEMQSAMMELQQKVMAARQQKQDQLGEKNRTEGPAFLEKNAARDGVVTTESGLQYEVLTEGDGEKPSATDRVRVHYRGTTLDGETFDSSYDRGEPVVFALNQVIAGWTEALQLMPVGSKWKVYVPADLAYGKNPPPGSTFGPDATLVFEIELLSIE